MRNPFRRPQRSPLAGDSRRSESSGSLFVWRGETQYWEEETGSFGSYSAPVEPPELRQIYGDLAAALRSSEAQCPFCHVPYEQMTSGEYTSRPRRRCSLCGFSFRYDWGCVYDTIALDPTGGYADAGWWEVRTLKLLDINSAELGLNEIGTHLRRHPQDVHYLTPRRFEELVADVYKNLGYYARHTQATRDGGYDVMLLEKATGQNVLVECKRYAADQHVRVGTVRELLGVQLRTGIRHGRIVTSTTFTAPAIREAETVNQGISGYRLELIDIGRLTTMIGVYNADLPPIEAHPAFFSKRDTGSAET